MIGLSGREVGDGDTPVPQNVRVPLSVKPHVLPVALAGAGGVASVWTPWPLLVLGAWALVAALWVDRRAESAVAAGVIAWSAGALAAGVLAGLLPGSLLAVGAAVQMAAVVLCSLVRPGSLVASLSRARSATSLIFAATLVPVAIGTVAMLRGTSYSWAVWNDGVMQLFAAREVVDRGGVDLEAGQPDPLVSTVLGWVMSSGRPEAGLSLLPHDGSAQASVTFATTAVLGVALALVVIGGVPSARPRLRVAMSAAGSLLAFSWFVSGFSVPYGFVNSLFALVLLAACWSTWVGARTRPAESGALLVVATVVMLGTWPVLAVVPASLAAVIAARCRREMPWRDARSRLVTFALVVVAAIAAGAVAVPIVTRPASVGGALVDGAFVDLRPFHALAYVIAALVVAGLASRADAEARWEATGLGVLTAASVLGLAFLSWQRVSVDGEWWYYYPQKLAWMAGVVVIAIVASLLMRVLSVHAVSSRDAALGPIVVAIACGALMFTVPPQASPLVGQGALGLARVAPILTLTTAAGDVTDSFRAFEEQEALAADVLAQDDLVIVSNDRGPAGEQWVNDLDLTESSRGTTLSLRRVKGTIPLSRPEGVCQVAETWARPLTVLTRDDDLSDRVADSCPGLPVQVEVVR